MIELTIRYYPERISSVGFDVEDFIYFIEPFVGRHFEEEMERVDITAVPYSPLDECSYHLMFKIDIDSGDIHRDVKSLIEEFNGEVSYFMADRCTEPIPFRTWLRPIPGGVSFDVD